MASEFVARNGIIALDNSTISGSLSVTNNISGSIFTGSFIGNLIGTSSQALTASYIQASGVVGLNLSQIATGSVTASVNINSGSFSITSGSTNFFFVSSSGNIGVRNITPSLLSGGTGLAISGSSYTQLQLRGDAAAGIEFVPKTGDSWEIQAVSGNPTPNSFIIYNRSDNAYRFLIDGNGNIGMGTTSPTAKLHVSGTSGALLQTTSGSTTGLFVSSSGNVGIGTTTPSASLQVNGGINIAVSNVIGSGKIYGTPGAAASSYLELYNASTGNTTLNSGAHNIQLTTAGTPRIYISSIGNVGISTATPNTRLDVNGNTLISGSLTVTGSITAQTLIVQTVSSSIIYSSGSNIFGNKATDTQRFTGSVLVSGSITVSGSVTNNLTASYALNADALDGINSTQLATTGSNIFRGTQSITGSLIVSSSTFATSLIGSGSGVFTVDGTSGRLFSVDDSLSGSLFSVNTAAGLPVIEAFSDNTVRIGQFGRRALFVSQSRVGFGKETLLNGNIDVSGSVVITGSLAVSGSIINNLTASFAISASYADNFNAGYAKTFAQLTPAVTWSFIHNLNSRTPLVQVYDLNHNQLIPANITNNSVSSSLITFATLQAGYVVLSTGGLSITGSNAILSQTTPSATWSFAHNLNTQFPVFTVFDSSNNVMVPLQINATNTNTASIYFSSPQIGTAVAANCGLSGSGFILAQTASYVNPLRQDVLITGSLNISSSISGRAITALNSSTTLAPLLLTNNASASYVNALDMLTPNLAAAQSSAFTLGRAASTNNTVGFNFYYAGAGSTSNAATFTFYGGSPLLWLRANGNLQLGTPTDAGFRLDVSGSARITNGLTITGSLIVSGSGTFRNIGPAAFTGSTAVSGAFNVIGDITGSNLLVTNRITTQTLVVQTVTSSVSFITGSTKFGLLASNTHQFTGSVLISGSSTAFAINNSALFVSSSGNVGIGTSNPLSLLDVNVLASGARRLLVNYADSLVTIKSANDTATAENLRVWGDNIFFYTGSAGSGGEAMRITNTGRVGIGTNSPSNKLTISNNGNSVVAFRINDTNANGSFLSLNASNSDSAIIAGGTSAIPFDIYTSGSVRMRIETDGSMGFNNSIVGSRSFVFRAITSRPIVIEAIENAGVHSMFFRPNNSGYNLISSNYLSGGTYLPLSLSARENNGDFILTNSGVISINSGTTNYHQVSIKSNGATTYQGFGVYSSSNDRFISINHTGTLGIIETENAGSGVMTNIAFRAGANERMRLQTNGVLKIGNGVNPDDGANPGYGNVSISFHTSENTGMIQAVQQGINVYTLKLNPSGGQVFAGSSRLDNISDIRMKTDITSLGETLEIINQLQPKKFHLIDEKNGKLRYGFVAQELEGILDEFVYNSDIKYKDEETGYEVENVKGIENWASSWAALLVKAIQELKAENDTLKEILQRNNIQ